MIIIIIMFMLYNNQEKKKACMPNIQYFPKKLIIFQYKKYKCLQISQIINSYI